jgi:nucleolar protein 4
MDTNSKVTRTRLAVFKLPVTAWTGQIGKIFAVAPKKYGSAHKQEAIAREILGKAVRITEVRTIEGQDGLAFLEFTEHVHALAALRQVNNHANYFEDRRLIVEFAVENNNATRDQRKKEQVRKQKREMRKAIR